MCNTIFSCIQNLLNIFYAVVLYIVSSEKYFVFFFHSFTELDTIVRMLIENGANVNAADENHDSALMHAVIHGNITNLFVVFNCLTNKTKQATQSRRTTKKFLFLLMLSAKTNTINIINTGQKNIVTMLIENGADVHAVDKDNNTALIIALYQGKYSLDRV